MALLLQAAEQITVCTIRPHCENDLSTLSWGGRFFFGKKKRKVKLLPFFM